MVSRIPYPHVMNQLLSGQRSLGHIVALLFSAVVIIAVQGYSVPIICALFVLGPAAALWLAEMAKPPATRRNRAPVLAALLPPCLPVLSKRWPR